jgi:Caspase domain
MKSSLMKRLVSLLTVLIPASLSAGPLSRHALIVGANNGGADRPRLQYAVSDAERFARVMVDLGGVSPENEIVLRDPKVGELLDALRLLHERIDAERRAGDAPGGRTEAFLYYSGHADEKGLLLGEDRLSYRSLRDRLDEIPADVQIAVLDACASGAFTRLKGGHATRPFLVDDSAAMRGHAFLTSSSETESAQESDRLRASYFTYYLVSGFRGAADLSGDGQVTLNEAYQFAFTETLGRTVDTRGGAQHPSYDINLSGAGDVVITDVRQTTARLVLGEELEGRFFIRASGQGVIVELYKPRGRSVEIGLEPGSYEVRLERADAVLSARTEVADGARVVLAASQFGATNLERTRRRGDGDGADAPRFAVAGRNRLAMTTGVWGSHGTTLTVAGSGFDVFGSLQYTRYLREDLALTVGMTAFGAEAQVDVIGGPAIPVGVRWNPRPGERAAQAVKPYLSVGLVPVTSADSSSYRPGRHSTLGLSFGGGVDLHLGPSFVLGLNAAYNAVPGFNEPVDLHDNFKGIEVSVSLGLLFGDPRHLQSN